MITFVHILCYHLCYHLMLSFFTVSKWYHFYVIIFPCTYIVLSFMLSFGVIIYFMLSFNVIIFDVIIWCYHLVLSFGYYLFNFIIWCYHFSQFANVIIFVLSFFLVQDGCYHLCYHLMLSFFVIISPLFSFSWKRDTLLGQLSSIWNYL